MDSRGRRETEFSEAGSR